MALRPARLVGVLPQRPRPGPGLDEFAGQEAGRRHEEGPRAAGDIRHVQVEDVGGGDRPPLAAVVGLMGAGRVDEGFEGVPHHLLRQGAGRVVGAGVLPRRRLHHDQTPALDDHRPSAQIGANGADPGAQARAQALVPGDGEQEALDVGHGVPGGQGLGQGAARGRLGPGPVLLEPGDDGPDQVGVVGVRLGETLQDRQRDLGLLALLAAQPQDRLRGPGAGIAQQTLVDVADLLHVDVPEGQATGLLTLEAGGLKGAQHVEHDPVGDGEQQGTAGIGGRQEGEAFGVE